MTRGRTRAYFTEAKATHGDSGIYDRYEDFLVHEEKIVDHEKPNVEFEANGLVLSQKNGGVVVVEVNHQNGGENEKFEDLPWADSRASTSHGENGGHETFEYMEVGLRKKTEKKFKKLYLNKLSHNPEKHEFYCPNCKTCITKVLVRERELHLETNADLSCPEIVDQFRCISCFSLFIPTGNWFCSMWSTVDEAEEPHLGTASEEILQTSTVTVGSRRDTRWEIVKSIVYGGLVESITSLGIVTSAASGDATTLNIVALALANLIGGLFIIAHNIWELRDDQSTVSSSIYNRMADKYQEVLGRRENYVLHATLAILSFIVFGLVPPVVYGLTFRESNDKELKLAAVGVASLICIAILAIGKAYIQRPNKYIKTIVYYLVTGFGVSGASYVAGELISKLLKKIESSDSTPALDLLLPGTGKSNPAWGSY